MEEPFRIIPIGTRLIETMLWSPGHGVSLQRLHRARMCLSARQLGFVFDPSKFDATVGRVVGATQLRLRLTLDREGQFEMTCADAPSRHEYWRIAVTPARLESSDPWRRVKSTNRRLFDEVRGALPEGLDEAIFLNEKGHACEGTVSNLLYELDGRWYTPPLSDGVLPGVFRAGLLARGVVHEASVTLDDLRSASRVRVCNALRGLVEAELISW